jgi:hypothetical protein
MAVSILCLRALRGTTSGGASGSLFSQLSVGGRILSSRARMQATLSIAPAAPSMCPTAPFMELTGTFSRRSPKMSLSAFDSAISPARVAVAWAFT